MNAWLDRFFRLTARGSTVRTELIAGLTTFLTMVYIVPTNAFIMSQAGMPIDALVTATALITAFACILNGLWANTPVAMSVGMGLNAFFTFGIVMGMNVPWQTALGVVFLSSFLFLALSLTSFRRWIIESLPEDLKRAISAGIGAFIAFIGLKQIGIIGANPATLVSLGHLSEPAVLLGIFGIFITFALIAWNVKGALMLAIAITAMAGWAFQVSPLPEQVMSLPASMEPIFMELDIPSALSLSLLPVIITFMITHMFDSLGTLAGVGARAGLFQGAKSSRELERTLQVDAASSTAGSVFGLSTITCFIESASGVEAGGRTGLTAIVTGVLFLATLFLLPLFKAIPANAIYPVLIMIGVYMFGELRKVQFDDLTITIPAFVTVLMMPLTFSIAHGIAAGFVVYAVLALLTRRFDRLNGAVVFIALVSLIPFIFHG